MDKVGLSANRKTKYWMHFHRCGAETGGCVDFNQPRLQVAVDDDVVPVALNSGEEVRKWQKLTFQPRSSADPRP